MFQMSSRHSSLILRYSHISWIVCAEICLTRLKNTLSFSRAFSSTCLLACIYAIVSGSAELLLGLILLLLRLADASAWAPGVFALSLSSLLFYLMISWIFLTTTVFFCQIRCRVSDLSMSMKCSRRCLGMLGSNLMKGRKVDHSSKAGSSSSVSISCTLKSLILRL